uniref:Uncharacterized protein n=1 Tax=Schistocephalus solidus TaxID=70667 RepID=A0A0X3PB66_SCHSO
MVKGVFFKFHFSIQDLMKDTTNTTVDPGPEQKSAMFPPGEVCCISGVIVVQVFQILNKIINRSKVIYVNEGVWRGSSFILLLRWPVNDGNHANPIKNRKIRYFHQDNFRCLPSKGEKRVILRPF